MSSIAGPFCITGDRRQKSKVNRFIIRNIAVFYNGFVVYLYGIKSYNGKTNPCQLFRFVVYLYGIKRKAQYLPESTVPSFVVYLYGIKSLTDPKEARGGIPVCSVPIWDKKFGLYSMYRLVLLVCNVPIWDKKKELTKEEASDLISL